jgi:mono/diheme cytochrome c family protein
MRVAAVVLAMIALAAAPIAADGAEPTFSRDVWPVFKKHCLSCHSGEKPEGGLRLDVETHIRAGGDSGPLYDLKKPEASVLLEQVSGAKPAMPPKGAPLAPAEVELLRRWIAAGAEIDQMPVDTARKVAIPKTYDQLPAITSVAISPDGKRIASTSRSEAIVVDLADGKLVHRLPTESDWLSHVEFSPDGKLIAVAGGTPAVFGEVRFFDAATGKLVGSRRAGSDTFFRGNFAPDGRSIALGGADGAAYVVPVDEKGAIRRFELHSDWVVDAAFTPDGARLATAGRDKTTKIADVKTGELLRTVDTALERTNSVVVDDGLAISAGLTKAVTGYQLSTALQNVEVAGAGNGARPVSRREQYVKNFEAQAGEVLDLALSGDRKLLAVAGRFGEVRLYTPADQKRAGAAAKVAAPVYAVALDREGKLLVAGGKSGKLDVYELPSGTLLRSITPVPLSAPAGKPATTAAATAAKP